MRQRRGRILTFLAASTFAWAVTQPTFAQNAAPEPVAGFESAGDLLRKCRENSSFARSYCYAYLAAVADAARSYKVWIGSGDPCLPGGLTMGRLADTFEAYLIANPSLTKAQAASVIVASLQENFPCPIVPPTATGPDAAAPLSEQAQNGEDPAPQQDRQAQE